MTLLFSLLVLGTGMGVQPTQSATAASVRSASPTPRIERGQTGPQFAPDRIIVLSSGQAVSSATHQRAGVLSIVRTNARLGTTVYRVRDAVQALASYQASGITASLDYIAHASGGEGTDPYRSSQWGLDKIQAEPGWYVSRGQNVKIAILDTGINKTHEDLQEKVILEENFSDALTTGDRYGHGTHVAGIATAKANNGKGTAGVAPDALLLSGKVLDDYGYGYGSDIEFGIVWATDHDAQVINISISSYTYCDYIMQYAINYAWRHGVVVVVAAGNDYQSYLASSPGNCQHVIPVAASDEFDQRAAFSNYGGNAVFAPGMWILSTYPPENQYAYLSGTSMASPHVAGLAALLWASPFGTSRQSVVDRIYDNLDGTRINVRKALNAPLTPPTPTPTATPTPVLTATPTATPVTTITPLPTVWVPSPRQNGANITPTPSLPSPRR